MSPPTPCCVSPGLGTTGEAGWVPAWSPWERLFSSSCLRGDGEEDEDGSLATRGGGVPRWGDHGWRDRQRWLLGRREGDAKEGLGTPVGVPNPPVTPPGCSGKREHPPEDGAGKLRHSLESMEGCWCPFLVLGTERRWHPARARRGDWLPPRACSEAGAEAGHAATPVPGAAPSRDSAAAGNSGTAAASSRQSTGRRAQIEGGGKQAVPPSWRGWKGRGEEQQCPRGQMAANPSPKPFLAAGSGASRHRGFS